MGDLVKTTSFVQTIGLTVWYRPMLEHRKRKRILVTLTESSPKKNRHVGVFFTNHWYIFGIVLGYFTCFGNNDHMNDIFFALSHSTVFLFSENIKVSLRKTWFWEGCTYFLSVILKSRKVTTRCVFKSLFDIMIKISRLGRGGGGGGDSTTSGMKRELTIQLNTIQISFNASCSIGALSRWENRTLLSFPWNRTEAKMHEDLETKKMYTYVRLQA